MSFLSAGSKRIYPPSGRIVVALYNWRNKAREQGRPLRKKLGPLY